MSAAHDSLLALAERQLQLAGEERWDELVPVMEEWQRRTTALTLPAPPSAALALARAAQIVALVSDRLRTGRMDAARELASLQRGRGAVRGYQAAALEPGGQVDGAA
ncbi:MAG: hypothetical protein AVDCRST_MAG69-2924 [uncultured Solirubrobacteraceae bacterium]|uniref:Flagellar protein FliT n=1 Tax=uncultured Solirubrobacteraceae bacterium TaxID=1162706 RepID=A0A6J4TB52_9ACTN|nr:MAG: hypothetical protein AVDCRST_MAG69-2924 [uncultured Solirubrobacteraceae bacterium]